MARPTDDMTEIETLPLRVFIADDDDVVRMVLRRHLEARGHEARGAGTAAEAMELLDRDGPFHAAFVDLEMPGRGETVMARLQEHPDFHGPIIVMSGDPNEDGGSAAEGHPRVDKPFRFGELVRRLEELAAG